ncbi:MAG: sulfotransferase [Parabacteroides sp.]|nr:sulfotransferase [Parabacteroides sp.]
MIQAVQIIGTQRSGSNLLRVMMDELPGVAAPHPPHILQRFEPLLPLYGELENPANFRRLATDICSLVNLNPVSWEGVELTPGLLLRECRRPSLYDLFRAVYEQAAVQTGATCWVCKSMKNVFYAADIEQTGLQPFYIYLYRDGRDVALSFKNAIVGEKHVYVIAQAWKNDQEACLALQRRTPAPRFLCVDYETLTAEPQQVMKNVCDFLHLPYTDRVLEYYKSRESAHTATAGRMWANVTRPVLKNNTRKFVDGLTPDEIAIFEAVAGDTLRSLGYSSYLSENKYGSGFMPAQIEWFASENARMKEAFCSRADPEDLRKREPQAELLRQIKNRPAPGAE